MPIALLLAMQAAGMVVDYFGRKEQIRLGNLGNQVNQAGIQANIVTSRLQSEDESLQAMKQLRMNLGTQAAMLAAKGTGAGGTSALFSNESTANFNADERMRKLNQIGTETALKASSVMSNLHANTFKNQTMGEFTRDVFDRLPTSPEAWNRLSQGFSKKNNYGFGLSKVS